MLRGISFGQCTFHSAITRVDADSDVHFAVLLLLAASPADGMSRDEIVRILWPGEGDAGRHCLRQTLYRLRTLGVLLRAGPKKVALADPDTSCDVHYVLHGTIERDELVRLGLLKFLPGYAPKLGDAFRRWVDDLRANISSHLRKALADEVVSLREGGRFHELGKISRALLAQDPLNEIGTMALAESLVFEGSKIEALRVLDDYVEEVGPINESLRVAPRLLRRRVSERVDESLLPRRFDIPFVGRERESAEMRAAFHEVRSGQARCVVLTGEAGIGKTRITTELMRRAALDGTTTGSYSTSAGDTFTPISTLVSVGQILLNLPGALGCAQEHLQYVRRLGTPETVSVWSASGIAADIAYAQLVLSIAELVRALADESPLILFIDDAQRLHQTTWRVLFDVLDRAATSRFMLILATRRIPEWFGTVCRDSCGQLTRHIRVEPFTTEESLDFVRHWSVKNAVEVVPNDIVTCAKAAAGNPFYLGELTAHAARGGDMRAGPKPIRELIEVQYAALSKEAQRVLLVIALFEGRATLPRITVNLEYPSDRFMAALDELEQAGLIAVVEGNLRCKHELVADTATTVAVESVRAFVRVRIAEQLEREAEHSESIELLGDVVEHWERAAVPHRAFLAAMRLGERLLKCGLGTDAEAAFDRAANSAERPSDLLAALEGSIKACYLSGQWIRMKSVVVRRTEVEKSSPGAIRSLSSNDMFASEAILSSILHGPEPAILREVAFDPTRSEDVRIQAAAVLAMWGDNAFDANAITDAFSAVREIPNDGKASQHFVLLRLVYEIVLGDLEAAKRWAATLGRLASDSDDYSVRIQAHRRAGQAWQRLGNIPRAIDEVMRSRHLAESLRLPLQEVACLEQLVHLAIAAGSIDEAHELAREMRKRNSSDPQSVRLRAHLSDSALAWISFDKKRAESLLQEASEISFTPELPKAEQSLVSARVAMEIVAEGGVRSEADVRRLDELHNLGARFGNQDFAASVISGALRSIGERTTGESRLSSFVSLRRRDVSPYPQLLLAAAERIVPAR